jgi:hypothetical protein
MSTSYLSQPFLIAIAIVLGHAVRKKGRKLIFKYQLCWAMPYIQ